MLEFQYYGINNWDTDLPSLPSLWHINDPGENSYSHIKTILDSTIHKRKICFSKIWCTSIRLFSFKFHLRAQDATQNQSEVLPLLIALNGPTST